MVMRPNPFCSRKTLNGRESRPLGTCRPLRLTHWVTRYFTMKWVAAVSVTAP